MPPPASHSRQQARQCHVTARICRWRGALSRRSAAASAGEAAGGGKAGRQQRPPCPPPPSRAARGRRAFDADICLLAWRYAAAAAYRAADAFASVAPPFRRYAAAAITRPAPGFSSHRPARRRHRRAIIHAPLMPRAASAKRKDAERHCAPCSGVAAQAQITSAPALMPGS